MVAKAAGVNSQDINAAMTETELLTIFHMRLGRVQSSLEVERFTADLYRSNHALMRTALFSVHAIATKAGAPRSARAAVQAAYDRQLAEIAQMFPVFFIFESAFRAFVAARLAAVYGNDLWWDPVRVAVQTGADPLEIVSLGGRSAKRDVVDTLTHLLRSLKLRALPDLRGTYDLLEVGTLAHVGRMISGHWADIAPALRSGGALSLTSANFADQFNKVRNARNDAYHHRPVPERLKVVAAAERLLDLLDVHLGKRLKDLRSMAPEDLPSLIAAEPRHG